MSNNPSRANMNRCSTVEDSQRSAEMIRNSSLAMLYAPAMAYERMTTNLDTTIEEPEEGLKRSASTATVVKKEVVSTDDPMSTAQVESTTLDRDTKIRDFAYTPSIRRKPVPSAVVDEDVAAAITRDDVMPEIATSAIPYLQQAGNAAQAKRKKRRISTAFSEMFSGLEEGEDGEEMVGAGEEPRPRRIKRIKTRVASWFGVQRK